MLEAHEQGGRTVVSHVRAAGLCRTSRSFRDGTAARIMVSHLGPGMVRGDAFSCNGQVTAGAHLIVTGQMATRVLSGPEAVTSNAIWHVGTRGVFELIAEPVLVCPGARYVSRIELVLAGEARAVVAEIVRCEQGGTLDTRTIAYHAGRLAAYDALRFGEHDEDAGAVGTLIAIGTGAPVEALDQAVGECTTAVRTGVGTLRDGGFLARVVGPNVWDVREALIRLHRAVTEQSAGMVRE